MSYNKDYPPVRAPGTKNCQKKKKQNCNINSHSFRSNRLEHFAEKEIFLPNI